MSGPRKLSQGAFTSRRNQPQPFNLPIPPPPFPPPVIHPHSVPPPPVPPSVIHPHSIPPPPVPPSVIHPHSIPHSIPPPPVPPLFLPQRFQDNTPPFPAQTFQSGAGSILPGQIHHTAHVQDASKRISAEECQHLNCQDMLNRWLRQKGISQFTAEGAAKHKVSKVKIHVMKEKLNNALNLVKELENGARTLSVMVKTVTPAEWDQKCEEIESKKRALSEVLAELKSSKEDIVAVKEKCSKRSKKRARLRRRAEQRKKLKEEEEVRNKNVNFQIDNWQREMQEDVERAQREEDLQREADAVLWGVTHKKNEARRQVALLSALLDLRQVRVQRLTAAGTPVSQLQIQTFNTVIERLKKMWTKHLDECLLEEQALRGMLTEADVKKDPMKTYKKLVLQEWEMALFGSVGIPESSLKNDALIDIRQSWDQFVVSDCTVLASTVPPGWVLPVAPSSPSWQALLKY